MNTVKTEDQPARCPLCGARLPAGAPQGLCPACLLAGAALPTEPAATPAARHDAPPSVERVAAAFPQLEVLGLIGAGGMGAVFKARQPKLDRLVALKLLSEPLGKHPAFAERFHREARVLAKLNHPNIVSVFDFGEAGGFYYLLMEFVDGANLRQAMRAGRFSPTEALAIVPKICEALQFAHEHGILHRDIKPENILLDQKGRVKIADFGIAKLLGEAKPDVTLTASGASLGTPAYMAPEQIEKPGEVDHRADIYSLGVVFYEMLTGELPLGRFAPPSKKTPLDERVDDIVLRALAKERELRQQSAGEVKTSVEAITSAPRPPAADPETGAVGGGSVPPRAAEEPGWWLALPGQTRSMIKAAVLLLAIAFAYAFVFYRIDYVTVGQALVRSGNVGWRTPWLSFWRAPSGNMALEYGFDFFTFSFTAGLGAVALVLVYRRLRAIEKAFELRSRGGGAMKSRRTGVAAGLVCASLVTGALLALELCAHQFYWWGVAGASLGVTLALTVLTLSLALPGTLIGALAFAQMRNAGAARHGWPVAVFAAWCWPALFLDALVTIPILFVLDSAHAVFSPAAALLLAVTLGTLVTAAVAVAVVARVFRSRTTAASEGPRPPQQGNHVSRSAIWGAALTGLSLPLPVMVLAAGLLGAGGLGTGELWLMVACLVGLGIPGTLLGWVALSQIRVGQPQVHGLPLALFAALTWPVLVLLAAGLLPPLMVVTPTPPTLLVRLLALAWPVGCLAGAVWLVRATSRWATGQTTARAWSGRRFWLWLGLTVLVLVFLAACLGPSRDRSSFGTGHPVANRPSAVQGQTSASGAEPGAGNTPALVLEVMAPPRETLVVSGTVLSNGVPVSGRELRAKLWPPRTRAPSPFVIRWQTLGDSDAGGVPWELVVEDRTAGTIAARMRPNGLPRLDWAVSPSAREIGRKTSTREAQALEIARALATGGGDGGAVDWSVRLQLQSSPLPPTAAKRGVDADFVLPPNQVATFELVARTNGVILPVPELAAYLVNGADESYTGKFVLADDPDDLDSLTAQPRWKFGLVGPAENLTAQGAAVPPVPADFVGSIDLWIALQADQETIHGLSDADASRPAYGLRIRTWPFAGPPGVHYRSSGFGTNWLAAYRQATAP